MIEAMLSSVGDDIWLFILGLAVSGVSAIITLYVRSAIFEKLQGYLTKEDFNKFDQTCSHIAQKQDIKFDRAIEVLNENTIAVSELKVELHAMKENIDRFLRRFNGSSEDRKC